MDGTKRTLEHNKHLFENPFHIEDLAVFDDDALRHLCTHAGLELRDLAFSLCGASSTLVRRVQHVIPHSQQQLFQQELSRPVSPKEVKHAQKRVLDQLFWELTYWKTPELYEELTEGEHLHPGIFQQLDADIRGKTVLDAGAGSGRATFECLRHGATLVYAVDPSPGLLRLLEQKILQQPGQQPIICRQGRFIALPLPDHCVDVALSCSAFTADPAQGGEAGLAELRRVTKHGGKIVLIWPQKEDLSWLNAQGFQHVTLPVQHPMSIRFRSLPSALACARRFYAHNKAVTHYLLTQRRPEVPFSVIGMNPPCDYCWLEVE
jgi:SAM-dependent methyltransferase